MRKILITIFTILLFFPFTSSAQTETYVLDPMHTYVLWKINHLGFSMQVGKFTNVEGTLTVDEAKPENSQVNVVIHTNDVLTGIPKLDEHLKNKDFFDVKKYPTATFVSNKIEVTGQNTGKVYGILTLHGVAKPVTLNVTLLKKGMHPMKNVKSLGFSATTSFKRSQFDMKSYLPALGDDVEIDIGAEATLKQ